MNSWFWSPRPGVGARLRLVCFAQAGGSASTFAPLAEALPPDVELWAVQLPGRAARFGEPAPKILEGVVSEVAAALRSLLDPAVPYALLGQSFWGLLACQVARALQPVLPPLAVIPVSVCPPHLWPWPPAPIAPQDAADFLQPADEIDEGLLADPEFRQMALDALATDLELLRQFHGKVEPRLMCPVHAITGTQDAEISWSEMTEWQLYTESTFTLDQLSAPHLLVQSHAREVGRRVTQLLASDLARLSASSVQADSNHI